ncbi:MAG: DMT family transporter [Herminiimonas sp.]|nr:DMT family transporter [Herminiimonas sp.]
MTQRLSPATIALLVIPPLLWAGNSIVGRMVHSLVPPMTLNFLRWAIAFIVLLPLAGSVLRPESGLWRSWKRFALLGLLGVGMYNALQYLALRSSTPINVTLVASSMPVWMLLIGRLFFGATVSRRQMLGAAVSIAGVLIVLCRGDWEQLLALRLVAGDVLMIVATICWSLYSWLLTRRDEPESIRHDWARFLLAQVSFGLMWSGLSASTEWLVTDAHIHWSWQLASALLYVAVGPAVIAYRCWGAGVQRVGPNVAAFFNNLTPLFAAVLSSAFLHESPHGFHAIAFALIVAGIILSSRR